MPSDITLLDQQMKDIWVRAAIASISAGRDAKYAAVEADKLMEEIIIRDRAGQEARALAKVAITRHA